MFDPKTAAMMKNISAANCFPEGYVMSPLLSTTAHFMGKAIVKPWASWTQPSILYTATVGFSGSNKTSCLDLFKESVYEIEAIFGICEKDSRLNQCK